MIDKKTSLKAGEKVPAGKKYDYKGKIYGAGSIPVPVVNKTGAISQDSAPTIKEVRDEL